VTDQPNILIVLLQWTFDSSSNAISPQWVNPDSSTLLPSSDVAGYVSCTNANQHRLTGLPTTYNFAQSTALYFGGDPSAFNTRYPAPITNVVSRTLRVCELVMLTSRHDSTTSLCLSRASDQRTTDRYVRTKLITLVLNVGRSIFPRGVDMQSLGPSTILRNGSFPLRYMFPLSRHSFDRSIIAHRSIY
jgi:hypothetical protein